jgi:fructose-1,6-bisphosphatase, class II
MEAPQRNLAMDLVRVTEAAALASARWLGKGAKNEGDGAAVDAMRLSFNTLDIDGRIVIGEGEKDEAPMLFNGDASAQAEARPWTWRWTRGRHQPWPMAAPTPSPWSVWLRPGPCSTGPELLHAKARGPGPGQGAVDMNAPVAHNLLVTANALGKKVEDLVVFVLDKPRHKDLISQIRAAGARIQLHTDGDVAGALMAVDPSSNVDMMIGTGGTPEGVLAACAIKALGGEILARFDPQSESERKNVLDFGLDLTQILTTDTLIRDDNVFFAATGISGGTFLGGVSYTAPAPPPTPWSCAARPAPSAASPPPTSGTS